VDRRRSAAAFAAHKEPVAAANAQPAKRVLALVVVDVQSAVVNINGEHRPIRERIIHRAANCALGQDFGSFRCEPGMEAGQERSGTILSPRGNPCGTALQGERKPVRIFVSVEPGTLFASEFGQPAFEHDGEVVQRLLPVPNRHRPLLRRLANRHVNQLQR